MVVVVVVVVVVLVLVLVLVVVVMVVKEVVLTKVVVRGVLVEDSGRRAANSNEASTATSDATT